MGPRFFRRRTGDHFTGSFIALAGPRWLRTLTSSKLPSWKRLQQTWSSATLMLTEALQLLDPSVISRYFLREVPAQKDW
jgi:hypothetical protein